MILEERKLGYTHQRYSTDRIRSKFNPIHSQTGYQNSKKKLTRRRQIEQLRIITLRIQPRWKIKLYCIISIHELSQLKPQIWQKYPWKKESY